MAIAVLGMGAIAMTHPADADSPRAECTTEEWILAADAIADYCVGLGVGYTGGSISSCENLGNGTFAVTAGCTMDI
jgi:hypothetical protein